MHIHMWPYKAIYIGISPDNDVHAHHAVQICIGLDKDISVQDYKAQSIHTGQCIVIFEDVPHKVLALHILSSFDHPIALTLIAYSH